jgi:hypothetical protein
MDSIAFTKQSNERHIPVLSFQNGRYAWARDRWPACIASFFTKLGSTASVALLDFHLLFAPVSFKIEAGVYIIYLIFPFYAGAGQER